jgi:hypothetical protein
VINFVEFAVSSTTFFHQIFTYSSYVFTAVKDSNSCTQVRQPLWRRYITTTLKELRSVRGYRNLHITL